MIERGERKRTAAEVSRLGRTAPYRLRSRAGRTVVVQRSVAGVEYALGYGWSIKSEYIYMNFRSKDFFAPPDMISCCVAPTFVSPVRVSLYDHTFKWGLNYKF